MLDVCECLSAFSRPVLVIWAPEDRVQRSGHGRRLAALLPDAHRDRPCRHSFQPRESALYG